MNNSIVRWERDFTRTLVRLAGPIALQALIMALMNILDNVLIGQLGQAELAGVTQANRVSFLLHIGLFGLVSGCSIFMAQFWGKRDIVGIRQMMGLSLMTAFAVSLCFAIPSFLVPKAIMGLLINDAAAIDAGAIYLRIIAVQYLFVSMVMVNEAALKSTEHVNLPMIAGIAGILVDSLFNYLLIFGKWGFPRMGIYGGALSTLMGGATQLSIVMIVSYRRKYPNAIRLSELLRLPGRDVVIQYYKAVAPVLLNEGLWSLGTVMYSVAYGRMGAGAVAAMSIFTTVEQLSFIVMRGTTSACAIMLGKSIGAGRMAEAQRNAKRFLLANISIGLFVGVFVMLFAGKMTLLFAVPEETREAARQIIFYFGMFVWLGAANGVLIVGIMRAGGDVVYSGIVDVIFLWCLSVPLVFWCGPHLGWPIEYLYLLAQVENLLKFVVGLYRMLTGKWRHNMVDGLQNEGLGA